MDVETDDTEVGSEDRPNRPFKRRATRSTTSIPALPRKWSDGYSPGDGSITAVKLSDICIDNGNDNLRSKAALKDELVYQLSSKTAIDWNRLLNQLRFEMKIDSDALETHQKYQERAEFVLYRINTWNPAKPSIFVINTADLSSSLRSELEQLQNIDPKGFDKLVTDAIQTIFEGINARYYHTAGLPYKVAWRFES